MARGPADARGMTVSRLARQAGVGVETVRYYQRRGLMPAPRPPAGAAFRAYDEAHLRRLRFIRRAKAAGFSLDEIAELLDLDPAERQRASELARARLETLDRRLAELQAARTALAALLSSFAAAEAGPCPILQALMAEATEA